MFSPRVVLDNLESTERRKKTESRKKAENTEKADNRRKAKCDMRRRLESEFPGSSSSQDDMFR
jgi:hypothetical protein